MTFKPDDDYYKWNCEKYFKIQQFGQVINYALLGIEFNPKGYYYYSFLGRSYYYTGKHFEAYQYLSKFKNYYPNSEDETNLFQNLKKTIKKIGLHNVIAKYKAFDFQIAAEWLNIYWDCISVTENIDKNVELQKIFTTILIVLNPNKKVDQSNEYYKLLIESNKTKIRNWSPVGYFRILNLEEKIRFGKHKGKTIEEIALKEPYYLSWCIRNIEEFVLSNEAMLQRQIASLGDFIIILEINLLKHFFIETAYARNIEIEDLDSDIWDEDEDYEYDKIEKQIDRYGKYAGYYVQSELGLSDNFIDDALGGEPNAYWNID